MSLRFSLIDYQVPSPPTHTREWADVLRWMICVMDPADTRLAFVAGCLSYSLKHGGLSAAQADACNKIYARIISDHKAGILVCQNTVAAFGERPDESRKGLN